MKNKLNYIVGSFVQVHQALKINGQLDLCQSPNKEFVNDTADVLCLLENHQLDCPLCTVSFQDWNSSISTCYDYLEQIPDIIRNMFYIPNTAKPWSPFAPTPRRALAVRRNLLANKPKEVIKISKWLIDWFFDSIIDC